MNGQGDNENGRAAAQQLREACSRGDLEAARALLAAGASVNAVDKTGKTALYFAAKQGDVGVMALLLDHGAKLRVVTKTGASVLFGAALGGNVAAVRFLLEHGHPVDVRDKRGRTVLLAAAHHGDVETMRVLIDRGVDVHATDYVDERTAMHCAAQSGSVEALQFLMAQGLALEDVDDDETTLLHLAAECGHVNVMAFLLEQGASVDDVDDGERTVLHYAAHSGHAEAVKFLLGRGASVDEVDDEGHTAFLSAATNGHLDAMQLLVDHGANVHAVTENDETALHFAARVGHVEAIASLVKHGLSVDAVDRNGASVLSYAATQGHASAMARLIECGADIQLAEKNGRTVLHVAARSGRIEAVELLLDRGLSANALINSGATVFHYAAMAGDVSIMRVLLERGADAHATTKNGQSAMHFAADSGNTDAVAFLVEQGLPVDPVCKNGRSPFHWAATNGDVGIMNLLLDHGADAHAIQEDGGSALHCAAQRGHAPAVAFLLDQGLSAHAVDKKGNSVFLLAAENDKPGVMKVLMDRNTDANLTLKDGRSALHFAAQFGNVETVSSLLKQGVDADAADENGASSFHIAVKRGDIGIIKALIDHGVDIHAIMKNGQSALHCAVQCGDPEIVSLLLTRGLTVDSAEESGRSPFHYAASNGNVGIMKLLLDHGADASATTKHQGTALHSSGFVGSVEMLDFLLQVGLQIDSADQEGQTALHCAAIAGNVDFLQGLVDRGANVHARLKSGGSALHLCAENGQFEAAMFFLDQGIAIDDTDKYGNTPLHVATMEGEVKMMRFLVNHGADVHALTKALENIVYVAVDDDEIIALRYALELGVDVNARAKVDEKWESPLVAAFSADCDDSYQMALALCAAGARFDGDDRQAILSTSESTDLSASEGTDDSTSPESVIWRSGLCACVDHWTEEHDAGLSKYTKVPMELISRGEAFVRTYLKDAAQSDNEDRLHRCKVCVVGPSEWGKTSLVQSLKTEQTFLTQLKDRTIGIDLTTCELTSVVDHSTVRLEITFWDFAGQDVYHAAHTLFFSQRTLFVLVVDLDAYWKELKNAETKPDQVSEAQMNRFVGAKIFRWVRSIFAHRPDAQFVVVGSKVDRLDDARVVAEIWDDLRDRVDRWKAAFAKGFDADILSVRARAKDIKEVRGKLAQLGSSDWLVANIMEAGSIRSFRSNVQSTISSSELGFPMWKTYTTVLRSVVKRREQAQHAVTARERIEKSIIRFTNLRRQLLREIDGLEREACEQILRILNDLGDVLWYEHDGAGVFKDCVILDPMLVIEIVREVVRHDFSSDADGKAPRDGRITHSLLSTFPLWKDMDVELMHAFKALPQHFQLAYPADADTMLPESDIIVPAYWNADHAPASGSRAKPKAIAPQKSVCDAFAVHRWCWEYEVPSELSETLFVQFAVQSHSSYLARTIRGFCVEAACPEFATSISLVQRDSPRDVLRIEVSGVSAELSWHNMRFYLMKMEKVLLGYPGDVVWRSIVYRAARGAAETRHPVGPLVKAVEDAITMGRGTDAAREKMPWMPPDMDWFMHKAWNDIAAFQQLRMDQLVHEKLEVLQKLAIVGDAPRRFPALWSLEYVPSEQRALLRMSSDLSGRCYHVPVEIDTGSALLARHASVLKAGVSLFATVAGNAISLPIVQNVLDAAKAAFAANADHAERIHNLIDRLDLSSQQFDALTNSKLSPGASMALLRDLLKAYDDSLDALEISEISNLECAVTSAGEYVWAHTHEIAAMKGKLTRCSVPPSTWKELELPETASINAVAPASSPGSPGSSTKTSSKTDFKFSVSVDSVVGLSDWDWHKTYCKWQLYFGRKSLTPLAVDVTPTNGDSSCAPSWSTMRKKIESVASVEMLRECRLTVQVKRRSRIGWTKLIGDGEVWLRDFVDEDASQNFACEPVRVPLGAATDRVVVLQLALEH